VKTKVCTKCKTEKPIEEFYVRKKEPLRYFSACKECIRGEQRKRWKRSRTRLSRELEKDLLQQYFKTDVISNGKVVMKDGKVIDSGWWKEKVKRYLKKNLGGFLRRSKAGRKRRGRVKIK